MNLLGEKIKIMREQAGLLQREVAAVLEIDTPMLSKIERGERRLKKDLVIRYAYFLKVDQTELLTLLLADRILELLIDEPDAEQALTIVMKENAN